MNKIELTINELLVLEQDLAELLNKELPFKLRFRVMEIAKMVVSKLETFKELNNNLIKEFGEEVENQIVIKRVNEDGTITDNFKSYTDKLNEIVAEVKELEYTPIDSNDVPNSVTSKSSEILFRLVK